MHKTILILFYYFILSNSCDLPIFPGPTKCYEELGCFENGYPWTDILRPFPSPQEPSVVNTSFFIANRQRTVPIYFQTWPTVQLNGKYKDGKPVFFLVHGFFSKIDNEWAHNLTSAILYKVDANVICVDWEKGSSTGYFQASSNTRMVAAEISRVVRYLIDRKGVHPRDLHMMGHSLGAHIMGYVGKSIPGLGRITAMDPAQPGFQMRNPLIRLNNNDAKFIDVIHTDGKPFLPMLGMGMSVSIGDVDFYVNGGTGQPNCMFDDKPFIIKSINDIAEITIEVLYNMVTCSHTRAPRYMASAIQDCQMWGYRYNATFANRRYDNFILNKECNLNNCNIMGLETHLFPARGNFAMKTTGSHPFCIEDETATSTIMNELGLIYY